MNINIVRENISQDFLLKKIDKTRNYFIEEISKNDLMSKKHKKVCMALYCIEHLLSKAFTWCVSISDFASLVSILTGIASSAVVLKSCVINAGIKKYKLIIKEKEKETW